MTKLYQAWTRPKAKILSKTNNVLVRACDERDAIIIDYPNISAQFHKQTLFFCVERLNPWN